MRDTEMTSHYLLFAARKVPRSAGGQASAYAGQVIAQHGDVGDGVAGLRFVVAHDAAFSRLDVRSGKHASLAAWGDR